MARHGPLALAPALAAFAAVALSSYGAHGWSVLVLGGTGFRGHPTTERLVREGHDVTVVCRGTSYWGIREDLEHRGVKLWKCNRTLPVGLERCQQLTETPQREFDAAVDFSSSSAEELKQAAQLLRGRVGVYVFVSTHTVYDVSKNVSRPDGGSGLRLLESDAARPGREVSPLERYQLKDKSAKGNSALECEEELLKQYNAGGFPYVVLRLANVVGPKENTIRYWLLHLWIRAHLPLTLPLHLDESLQETPISFTYTPDIAQAVVRVIAKSRNETCCLEHVQGEAFNLACEEAPTQQKLYNHIAEPIGVPYMETTVVSTNKSIVLYPDNLRGAVGITKALEVLRWSPTDFGKAMRSVTRFYERVMVNEEKYKREREIVYGKCKKMLGKDGSRFVSWLRQYYDERRSRDLYDELDDEDEDDIVMARPDPERRPAGKPRKSSKRGKGSEL